MAFIRPYSSKVFCCDTPQASITLLGPPLNVHVYFVVLEVDEPVVTFSDFR